MKITVTVETDDREGGATHLLMISKMIAMGMGEASGHNADDNTAWSVEVLDDEWPHGDYHDETGNLLHVHVTRANGNADTENVHVPVNDWMDQYGTLTYIPQTSAESAGEGDS